MAKTNTTGKASEKTNKTAKKPKDANALTAPERPPFADLVGAPYPTKKTLKRRRALVPQFFKFLGFNTSIMRMVLKGHGHSK